jgi:hypothetical protein
MLLLRLLLFILIGYIVFLALKSLVARKRGRSGAAGQIGEHMVLDPQCNTYIPKSEAIARGGEFFCSEECARLYLAR